VTPVGSRPSALNRQEQGRSVSDRPSVCFVAPRAYAALSGREDVSHVGGAERQQVLLGEELVRRGYRVSFVVLDHGQPDGEEIGGIRVFKCYRTDMGVRGLRFVHPRLTGLWSAMERAAADVYYQRGAEAETGLVGHWCRRHGRGFMFAVAHDSNCLRVTPITSRFERWLFRYGVRRADAVIAQTFRQQRMLEETFALASTVIRSCCQAWPDLDHGGEPSDPDEAPDRILWVGRLSAEKRPDWVIRLATDLPECRFDVVGQSNVDSRYGRMLEARLRALPNVRWHGYVAHARMRTLYRQCRLLLCTSESEGFPNVFLEAWSCARPVLTSVDPDDVVATFQLGQVATHYLALKERLAAVVAERPWWEAAGLRGREHVRANHSTGAAADALAGVMERCVSRRATRGH
jgi:glycosyltransferase involved in cell wall biosynthesis